ncbi:MAG: M14 family zinc carboxypeptidase, partial [Planctomycetota bacterium]|nr:M14 family zinc carboxypeptidase [Planctomycetota bacterium]
MNTIAESSDFTQTASHAQVMELLDKIEAQSSIMRRGVLGKSVKGKTLPLVILANPPIENAAQARASSKPIFFAFGNIHAGEVCGKEALLMLIREIATNPDHPLLNKLVIVFAPIYNADGNDEFGPIAEHRRGQNGPEEVGLRSNAMELDLNRDYIKLESPEAQAMVRFATEWDPHVVMDLHTTNGSRHRYTVTYETPRHPAAIPAQVDFARNEILPVVTDRVFESTGYRMFYYGNYNWRGEPQTWATYEGKPRFGGHYHGLRGTIA